ncbi:MAG: SusC/RagA family TonB-linked outer membrane protein [Prevotella sp.]|jgi:TonB-linked SusC/RagA family outer membrane protein
MQQPNPNYLFGRLCILLFCIFAIQTTSYAQNSRLVSGRVLDKKGETLIGVSVSEKGNESNTVITDVTGAYRITLTTDNPVLKFNYIGFKEKEVNVGADKIIDVALDEDVSALDEVVVVGFGTQKKASVVGAISNIKPKDLSMVPSRSMSNSLAGLTPGVIAVQRSGDPWYNNSDFWIRGISSFAGNTRPLVLIDGIERSLNDIDPEEIASFSVLKDAAASAVYGVRGANGVIMIETKRGEIGKPQVNVRFEHAFTQPTKMPEYVGSVKYLELMNDMYREEGKAPMVSDAVLENYRNHTDPELYPDVNWWDVVSKDYADNTRATLNISGGSKILRYALVASYFNENGILQRDKTKEWDSSLKVNRYTVRSNVDINVTSSTIVRINIGGYLQTRNSPPGDVTDRTIFYHSMRIPPYIHPAIYADGRIPRVQYKENPWAFSTQRGYRKLNHSSVQALTSIEQDLKFITPGLSARLSFSFDKFANNSVERAKNPDYYFPASGRDYDGNIITNIQSNGQEFLGYVKDAGWGTQSTYLEGMINYSRTFAKKHAVNAMLLYNQKNFDDGSYLPFRNQGFAGRMSYTYDDRYVAEFNFGYNGSENFAPGKRFGFFPAVALGWVVTEEPWMRSVSKTLSLLKLRASWGKAGNSNINGRRFAYISTIANTGYYYFGTEGQFYRLGRAEGEIGVPDLTWETVTKTNVGVDMGLFNGSVSMSFDIFKEWRKDIFMQRTNMPGSAGFNRAIWDNYGKVENSGIDFSINVNHQFNHDFQLTAMANFTYAHNKVTEIDEPEAMRGTYRSRTGKPVGQLFGLVAERLFDENDFDETGKLKEGIPSQKFSSETFLAPGDIKYKDMNGDGEITALDQTAIGGTVDPQIVYGFGATLRYKQVDFGFFFSGVGKTDRILGGETWLPASSIGAGNIWSNIDDRWTTSNPRQDVFWPRMNEFTTSNNEQASTWWLKDMSFLRLKNLEIGYTIPSNWSEKIAIRDCRIFLRGSNLLTFSKFDMWDPEIGSNDGLKYPMMKSLSVGITLNFNN